MCFVKASQGLREEIPVHGEKQEKNPSRHTILPAWKMRTNRVYRVRVH
jgi:hypothetical protein